MSALGKKLASLISTFFYIGYLPKAPGTWGSAAALPLAWYLWQLPSPTACLLILVFIAIASWAAGIHDKIVGGHDNQTTVADEVAGIFVATTFAEQTLAQYAAAFVLFRIFDIWKPWPVRWIDRKVGGGFGVIADDLAAAVYAALILFVFNRYVTLSV